MNKDLNEFLTSDHYHEVADRLSVIMSTIDDHLIQHPVSKINKNIYNQLEKAQNCLWEAYQEAGKNM